MIGDQQRRLLLDMFENLPGVGFLVLSRATDDLRLTGWVGTILAAAVCISYVKKLVLPHPILLGINLFMVAITPLIEILFFSGHRSTANTLIGNIDSLVLGSVFVTGLLLTLTTRNGFLTYAANSAKQMRMHSAALLGVCAIGVFWSLIAGGNNLITLAIPLMLLFGLQQLLRAGVKDRQSRDAAILACHAPQSSLTETAI
ncbi:hypothetical protein [Ruegeria lacuscaerulensis]|uniref:hypothetical protein n=1 Tax=Ruegeria lacuscaerulensis TaxID=55218 RepID=UPI001481C7C8|nr:hypothetical protein [Ruegeria lacuscaerulensis]